MSRIKILSSGSIGNCLVIYDSRGKYILVDVGIGYKDILRGLSWDLNNCVLTLTSHSHKDHSQSLARFIKNGIPCYSNSDVCGLFKDCLLLDRMVKRDDFKVQTFDLVHNVPNSAFIIDTIDKIRILYCTDTQYIPKRVKDVNIAVIECNFDDDVILDNMCEGKGNRSQYENHHSLDRCVEYLRAINNVELTQIILWHPSSTNLNKEKAVARVKEELGFDSVVMAEKGLELQIANSEF